LESSLLVLLVASFAASIVNAAFATGGIFLLLATLMALYPPTVAVPLLSALAFGSLVARIAVYHHDIAWRIVRPFALGTAFGVLLAARIFVALPETLIATVLALVLIATVWLPKTGRPPPVPRPFLVLGFAQGFLSTLTGIGGLLQAVMLKTGLDKMQVTATLAAALLAQGVMKIAAYSLVGFDYLVWWPQIAVTLAAGLAGTWAGRRLQHGIDEKIFRWTYRVLVSAYAVRLLYKAWG